MCGPYITAWFLIPQKVQGSDRREHLEVWNEGKVVLIYHLTGLGWTKPKVCDTHWFTDFPQAIPASRVSRNIFKNIISATISNLWLHIRIIWGTFKIYWYKGPEQLNQTPSGWAALMWVCFFFSFFFSLMSKPPNISRAEYYGFESSVIVRGFFATSLQRWVNIED